MDVMAVHPWNAYLWIVVTPRGILDIASFEQPLKA
jgi:hypothetical protein